jgi:hypothetical protein
MGKAVVVDRTLTYLIGNNDDEIFIMPTEAIETELDRIKPTVGGFNIPNNSAYEYISRGPWDEYFSQGSKENIEYESKVFDLVKSKIKNYSSINQIYKKSDFEKKIDSYQPVSRVGSKELIRFLTAFSWVSKNFSIECFEIGDDVDYDFRLLKKSAFTLFGKKEPVLIFRWSEFVELSIEGLRSFNIKTKNDLYRASMGLDGFLTRRY